MKDFRPYVGRTLLVFTDFATFVGTLEHAGTDALTLSTAAVVSDDGGRSPVDGVVLVPSVQVQWVQVP